MDEPILETVTQPTESVTAPKKRRGRIRYAAPLGFLVLLFAVIGVFSVISGLIGLIVRLNDDTALRQDLFDFLNPVMQFCPSDFDSETAGEQDTLLLSSIYRVTEAERIRQLREKDEDCLYSLDETGWRMQIPQSVIADSYTALFGDIVPTHRTVGEVEYVTEKQQYLVPLSINTSGYTPVLGNIRKRGETYTVQVAYVANSDVQVDERGQTIAPSFDMGQYTQVYTVQKTDDGWTLLSVKAAD